VSEYGIEVVAFGAHPDDVELFAGGTIAGLAERGYSTAIVDLTRGERASRGSVEERAREADAAAQMLGLKLRENLGLPDAGIDAGSAEQLERAVEVLRRLRPELVLIPWIEERHPDHEQAGLLLKKAVFFAGVRNYPTTPQLERFVPRQVLHYQMRVRMTPSLVVDTSSVWEKKLRAIYCHASQLSPRPGEPLTLIGSGRAVAAIEARDRYYGSMIGATHGEPLKSPNMLGLGDLLGHFRQNPFTEAHAFESDT
jgi:bacillithiol biosynthesis deacetylase BshB1